MTESETPTAKEKARAAITAGRDRVARIVPPGFRWLVGLLLILGGVFGFLPILGFWMIPLGLAVAALDIGPLRRWLARRS